jgi:hypothetical protein
MDRAYSMHGENISNVVLVRKPERKRPLRMFTPRWEDNIKIDLTETG